MKLVIGWLAAIVLALVIIGSCSINHRSSDYECSTPSDCDQFPGRTCVDGFCVGGTSPVDARVGDGPVVDAHPDAPPDGAACPVQCSSCNLGTHTCTIDCSINSCNDNVVCPAGWNCSIGCNTANSCAHGIDCSDATSCKVTCSGASSCRDLDCGDGKCSVTCSGNNSCRDMDCSNSCSCDVSCGTFASCEATVCPEGCGLGAGRCSSMLSNQCDTCP